MTEEKFLKIICLSLKILAWFLLIIGIVFSIAVSAVVAPLILLSRWSGAVILLFFILVFLFINLAVKTAQMVFDVKKKVVS